MHDPHIQILHTRIMKCHVTTFWHLKAMSNSHIMDVSLLTIQDMIFEYSFWSFVTRVLDSCIRENNEIINYDLNLDGI